MGLDIYYGSNLVEAVDANRDEFGDFIDYDDFIEFYSDEYKRQLEGLKLDTPHKYDAGDSFRAGSYGGYNVWRNNLAILAGNESARAVWENPIESPFLDLINFTDCDGVIGPIASKRLHKDFIDFQDKAELEGDERFLSTYNNFRLAFECASINGFVRFA